MTEHPITPPPELAAKWVAEICGHPAVPLHSITLQLVERAAQWGSNQELEACCEWLEEETPEPYINALRAARRPSLKPPSLKEQALETLKYPKDFWSEAEVDTIRRALEQLPDNE